MVKRKTKRAVKKLRKPTSSTFHLEIPNSKKQVSVSLEVIPSNDVPETLRNNTNVAKMMLGGKEFLVVVGKTVVDV